MSESTVDELFSDFDNQILAAEWQAVSDEYPYLADIIRQLVINGVEPRAISRRVIMIIGNTRTGMAKRLENAAMYWYSLPTHG